MSHAVMTNKVRNLAIRAAGAAKNTTELVQGTVKKRLMNWITIRARLRHPKRQIANDCIKVLYEIGERKPELIADYVLDFISF